MTKQEIKELGFDRGYSIASWINLPEIGSGVDKCIDWYGIGDTIESVEEANDYFCILADESEMNDRQFSPFEFTAKELNDKQEKVDYDVWDVFREGIYKGVDKNWNERKGYYNE